MGTKAERLSRVADVRRKVTFDRSSVVALGYLFGVAVAEIVATFVEPRLGLVLHGLLLIVLLLHSARSGQGPAHNLLLSLALAPLIRLLSYSLPLSSFPRVYWYLVVSLPLFASTALAVRALRLPWWAVGMRPGNLLIQFMLSLSGIAFGYTEYYILRPESLVQNATWREILLTGLILLICTGFLEELIFRGLMQHSASLVLGSLGPAFVAVLFAILHIGYKSLVDVLFVLAVGLFFGWVVSRTGSILGVTLSHGITNIVLFIVMPLASINAQPVAMSGLPASESSPAVVTVARTGFQETTTKDGVFNYLPEDFQDPRDGDQGKTHEQGNDGNIQHASQGPGARAIGSSQRFLVNQERQQNHDRAQAQRGSQGRSRDR